MLASAFVAPRPLEVVFSRRRVLVSHLLSFPLRSGFQFPGEPVGVIRVEHLVCVHAVTFSFSESQFSCTCSKSLPSFQVVPLW